MLECKSWRILDEWWERSKVVLTAVLMMWRDIYYVVYRWDAWRLVLIGRWRSMSLMKLTKKAKWSPILLVLLFPLDTKRRGGIRCKEERGEDRRWRHDCRHVREGMTRERRSHAKEKREKQMWMYYFWFPCWSAQLNNLGTLQPIILVHTHIYNT